MRSDECISLAYDELRATAQRYLYRQRPDFTLCPTEIVHEACVQLLKRGDENWTSEDHFRAIAARKLWQVIVDHLKRRGARKRCGHHSPKPSDQIKAHEEGPSLISPVRHRVPFDCIVLEWHDQDVELLDLADALADLGKESRRLRDAVLLRWVGGMTHAEVARYFGVSQRTAQKDIRYALAWLNRRLHREPPNGN